MTWHRAFAVLAGWFLLACILAPLIGRRLKRNSAVCGHCEDEGVVIVETVPWTWNYCNFCMLGQQYERVGWQP